MEFIADCVQTTFLLIGGQQLGSRRRGSVETVEDSRSLEGSDDSSFAGSSLLTLSHSGTKIIFLFFFVYVLAHFGSLWLTLYHFGSLWLTLVPIAKILGHVRSPRRAGTDCRSPPVGMIT